MAIYSLMEFTTTSILEVFLEYSPDFQFLYWDVALNFLPIVFLGYTATADRLSVEKPRSTLFSLTNIAQILVMFAIQFAGQIFSILVFSWVESDYYAQEGGFDNGKAKYDLEGDFVLDGVEANATFTFVNNVMLVSVLAFSISHPWRKQFWTNLPFLIVTLLALAANVVLNLVEQADWGKFMLSHLVSFKLRAWLLGTSLGFALLIYGVQKWVLEPISYRLVKKYHKIPWI